MAEVEAGADSGAGKDTVVATTTDTTATAAPVTTETAVAVEKPAEGTEQRTTIAAGGGEERQTVAPADWPDNWRDKYAEALKPGDKKFRERLDRFNSPIEIGKSWLGAEAKISTGEVKRDLPEGATAEEFAAWKKERGLPVEAKDYIDKMELPKGMVLGQADRPIAESFAKAALARNWDTKTYNDAVAWYYEQQGAIQAQREAADDDFHQKSSDALHQEWGKDYRRNVNAVGNILATLPDEMHIRDGDKTEVGGHLLAARLPNGRLLGDHPAFVKWLANQAQELNPTATLVPAGTGNAGETIATEIANIEKLMKDRASDYWKGPKSAEMQQRYRDLIEGRDKMSKSRAA